LTGFMPRKPRFVSGVKRHVSESIKLNPGKPRLVAGSFTAVRFLIHSFLLANFMNL
jgi:hypothetical protein